MEALALFDSTKRVLVVGELFLEKHIHGTYHKVTMDSMLVFRAEKEESHLTGTGNVVKNLTAMGLTVDHISVIGNNEMFMLDLMKQGNLDTTGIMKSQYYSVKTIIRYFCDYRQCFWTIDDKGSKNFKKTVDLKTLIDSKLKTNHYSMIVISDPRQKLVSARFLQNLLSEANCSDIPTIVDIDTVKHDGLFCGISYGMITMDEHMYPFEISSDISARCKEFFDRCKTKKAVFAFFKHSLAFYTPEQFQITPISGFNHAVDMSGADDTLLASIVFGIIHDLPLEQTCNFASKCVGNIMQTFGIVPVTMLDVISQKVIRTHKELRNLKHFIPQDKTVVLTTGCFDMLHSGHVESLRKAKELGNILIVALNSDISVKSYKGETRPIIPLEQRCSMLQATQYVDFIVMFDERRPTWIVEIIIPDIFVKGEEYTEEQLRNTFPCLKKICFTPQITSTSSIIEKIKNT